MYHLARKIVRTGHGGLKERLFIKAFRDANELGAFLCKQFDNTWAEVPSVQQAAQGYPTKSGQYAFAGGQWHNVKRLDPSVLAHI